MTLPAKLPVSLGLAPFSSLFIRSGIAYNYAIGGLPFLSAASEDNPIVRETVPVQKDQIDDQPLPGEQSLSFWWLRSQQSFHGGAGQVFADPVRDNPFNAIRFRTSRNVNVWNQGELTLLHEAAPIDASPVVDVRDATEITFGDGEHAAVAVTSTHVYFVTAGGFVSHNLSAQTGSDLYSVTSDGSRIFVAAGDSVWSADIPASLATTPTWTKQYTFPTSDAVFISFVKQRLILAVGPSVYELAPRPQTPPAALPDPHFTAADDDWVWTGITEVASAILIAGNAGGVRGSVLKLTLAPDGQVVTLTAPSTALQLPFGEVPYSIVGYLGRFVGIGTNIGVRVGIADENGDVQYGPLLFETVGPVRAWAARDRFLWCTVCEGSEGESGLYRIDLSTEIAPLRFAYATDLVAAGDSSPCRAVAHLGTSEKLFFATSANAYVETDNLAPSGFLQTSRIRFNTLEPKVYRFISLRGPVLKGGMTVTVLASTDDAAASHNLVAGKALDADDIRIFAPSAPVDFISLRFDLRRDSADPTVGPTLWAYQVKALPSPPRQRFIQLPLLCFDWEIDRNGQRRGGLGEAKRKLLALEALEARSRPVAFQDFDIGETRECLIERVSFTQTAPPPKVDGWGGIVTVTLRTL